MQKGLPAELFTIVCTHTHTHTVRDTHLTHTHTHSDTPDLDIQTQGHTHTLMQLNIHTYFITPTQTHAHVLKPVCTLSNRHYPRPGHPDTHSTQKPTHSRPRTCSRTNVHSGTCARSPSYSPAFSRTHSQARSDPHPHAHRGPSHTLVASPGTHATHPSQRPGLRKPVLSCVLQSGDQTTCPEPGPPWIPTLTPGGLNAV